MTNKSLVIFIHGLTGGTDTWKNISGQSFSDLLKTNEKIVNNFDFVEFDYFTKIANIKNSMVSQGIVKFINYVPGINLPIPERQKNVSFLTISEELATFIEYDCCDYNNIFIVAHSMGGLIGKRFILDLNNNRYDGIQNKVIGYVSLATPHKGTIAAELFGSVNINIKELGALSKEVNDLNDSWVESIDLMPPARYVIAKSDDYVKDLSSVPSTSNKTKFKTATVPHSHTSICKPKDNKDLSYKIVEKFIIDSLKNIEMEEIASTVYDPNLNSYDKEIFVLKLILANVEDGLIDDAKESFFHADVIFKSAPEKDRKVFDELQKKVLSMYRTYSSCSSDKTASEIVKNIHEKIIELDKTSIDCVLNYINFIHKKGLLHHESNKRNMNVNWSENVDLNMINMEVEKNA
ncbi:TPA: ABC-three component system protein [Vibrio diabolicus]